MTYDSYTSALLIVIVPLIPLLIPGFAFISIKKNRNILLSGARMFVWSMGLSTLATLLAALVGIPGYAVMTLLFLIGLFAAWYRRKDILIRQNAWRLLAIILPIIVVMAIFAVPFLLRQQGMPTGDSQKTIFWAEKIAQTNHLPDYSISNTQLNRDPVDFYTPGLHTLTAYITTASRQPLTNVGLFALIVAGTVAWIGAALTKEVLAGKKHLIAPLLTAILILTNTRFLRYIREPGYHFQNLIGEFFLFAFILFGIRLVKKWNWHDAALAILAGLSLIVTHQFSAFIGFFAAVIIAIALLMTYRHNIRRYLWHHSAAAIPIVLAGVGFIILGVSLGLHTKIPHLFTAAPHLLPLVPSFSDYPALMGSMWFLSGISGLLLLIKNTWNTGTASAHIWAFIAAAMLLLVFSQGPRIFLDIPPVRSLFYTVVPLSIAAAYFITRIRQAALQTKSAVAPYLIPTALALSIIIPTASSTYAAFAASSRDVRTNSTLSLDQLQLIETVKAQASDNSQAILVDDYDRRSTSWFLLTNQPTYARIAADLERQMAEAGQSQKRYDLYLKQLDYEKIFSLGSKPIIRSLMQKHGIAWITGIEDSTNSALQYNPAVRPVASADKTTLYEIKLEPDAYRLTPADAWLLKTSTLVNDIGDREDTFEHLPASLRSTQLSDPQVDANNTYRIASAPLIPLAFNVGGYTRSLWDKNSDVRPDSALEFRIEFTSRPVGSLQIQTSTGKAIPLPESGIIQIPPRDVYIDEKGFVTITLMNPDEAQIAIDLIALGLAQVP